MDDRKKTNDPINDMRVHPEHFLSLDRAQSVRRVLSAEPADDEPKKRAIVARGRCVDVALAEQRAVCGSDQGRDVMRARQIRYGPGEEVELPASEVARLRGLGFLVDPDGAPPAAAQSDNLDL